jgi:RNA polymerase sigma-70 factor (ECF subfamily)
MHPAPGYDPDLLASARLGDRDALEALLVAAQPDIRRYARVNCKAADADDAVQETLWLLYRKVGTIRALQSFTGWLFMVVRRECIRLARMALRQDVSADALEADLAFAHRPQEELRLDLTAAIQSLPQHYRDIVLLRDIEELTIDEIALTLSLSREAVKARLHRARKLIRDYLQPAEASLQAAPGPN